jgi:hypothetical protein
MQFQGQRGLFGSYVASTLVDRFAACVLGCLVFRKAISARFAPESCLDGRSFYLRGLGRSVREVRCSTPADEAELSAQGRGIANVPAAWVVRQTTSRQLRGVSLCIKMQHNASRVLHSENVASPVVGAAGS